MKTVQTLALTALLALTLVLLSACGGGDAGEQDDTKSINPPNCQANPELCK